MHWLDEIEKIENRRRGSASDSARVQDKKFRISQNYKKNKNIYEGFITKLVSLVDRVNRLPMEHREVFGKINFKKKDTKLDNHLCYFSSSRRMHKTEFRSLLRPFKTVHYKHIRVIYFNIAKLMDKVEVEIHEEFLEKKRRDGQVVPESEGTKGFHKPHSERNNFHEVYYYDMGSLNDELAYRIIDWLVFREEVNNIPVVSEGQLRFNE